MLCFRGLAFDGECLTRPDISIPELNLNFFFGVWKGEGIASAPEPAASASCSESDSSTRRDGDGDAEPLFRVDFLRDDDDGDSSSDGIEAMIARARRRAERK